MAYNDQNGNTILSTVNSLTYQINKTNFGVNVPVTGYSDTIWTPWGGIIGAQIGLLYDSVKSNSYLNLYARHMGGWAQTNLGLDALDQYDAVALQRTGDWVLNLNGTDKVIGGAGAGLLANLYMTSNATINTDGSLASIHGGSGNQNVSIESGLTGNQAWDRQKDNSGNTYSTWTVTGSLTGTYSTTQHDNAEQATGAGLTQNAAGDVNGASTISLGAGTDNITLLNDTRYVTDYWWQSYWIFGGTWHSYTYNENAWTVYWTGSNWNAYNNYKDYTVTMSTDVETIYYSEKDNSGNIDYKVYKPDGTIDHYPGGFPPLGGPSNPSSSSPAPSLSQTPTPLDNGGFLPSTTGGGTSVQFFAPKGSKVAFYTSNTPSYHNEGDNTVTQPTNSSNNLAELTTFTSTGVHNVTFAARDSGTDSSAAALGTIRVIIGVSASESDYNLYLGTNGAGDNTGDLSLIANNSNLRRVLGYGFNGNDQMNGSAYADTFVGGDGNDTLSGGNGNDSLFGGNNNDELHGDLGQDWLDGEAGNDTLDGSDDGSESDTLLGGTGTDTIYGGAGDFVQGGSNNDTLIVQGSTPGTTYIIDNEGVNTITVNGADAVYFSATNKGNYTNNINNSSTVTMVIEHGSTTSATGHSGTMFNQSTTPSSAYVNVPDSQNVTINAVGAGNVDVINFYGGDLYDTTYSDHTVNTYLFGTWYQWRNWGTTSGGNGSKNLTLSTTSLVAQWATDGQVYYGSPSGIMAPLDPNPWYQVASASYIQVSSIGYKGYFTFYNARSGTSAIYYAQDINQDGYIGINNTEMTYLGYMSGQAGSSLKYGTFTNGQFSFTNEAVSVAPLDIVSNIDLATIDDDGIDNTDNVTTHTTGLTLTATIQSGVTTGGVTVYDWVDLDDDGVADANEISQLSVTLASTPNATTFQGDIALSAGSRPHHIAMTQTLSSQTSDVDFGSALIISVKTDITPPNFTTVNASSGSISVTVDETSTLTLINAVSPNAVLGSSVSATANTPASIAVSAQSTVWNGAIVTTDAAANFAFYDPSIWLGTGGVDNIAGAAGSNIIYGFAGNDVITGGSGNDTIFGGANDDTINAGTGDVVDGEANNDSIVFAAQVSGATVTGGTGADTITLPGGTTTNAITVNDSDGITITAASTGVDAITLGASTTATVNGVQGTASNDVIVIPSGSTLTAQAGAAWTATSATTNAGTASIDANGYVVNLASAAGSVGWTVTNSSTTNGVALTGSAFADTFTVGAGSGSNNTVTGGAGADTIHATSGTVSVADLGNGADIITVAASTSVVATMYASSNAVSWSASSSSTNAGTLTLNTPAGTTTATINLSAMTTNTGTININASTASGTTTLTGGGSGITNITGGANADTITAGVGGGSITGGAGGDHITAGVGVDTFTDFGVYGNSVVASSLTIALIGSTKLVQVGDTITFATTAANNVDAIAGFTSGSDKLDVTTPTTLPTSLIGIASDAVLILGTTYGLTGNYNSSTGAFVASATGTDELIVVGDGTHTLTNTTGAVILTGLAAATASVPVLVTADFI